MLVPTPTTVNPLRRRQYKPRGSPTVGLQSLLLITLVLFIGGALALMLALGQLVVTGALAGMILLPIATLCLVHFRGARNDWIFWTIFVSVFAASLVGALLKQQLTSIYTGMLLVASPVIVLSIYQHWRLSYHLPLCTALVLAFFAVGLVSSILGRSHFLAATYTIIMSLKPFILAGFGAMLLWTPRSDRIFTWLLRWMWLPLLTLTALQWFTPGVYGELFPLGTKIEGNPFVPGFPRAFGGFPHPGVLAITAACFGLYCLTDAILSKRFILVLPVLLYSTLIIMSGQRQELAAFLLTGALLIAVIRWRPSLLQISLVAAISVILVLVLLYLFFPENLQKELQNWGLAYSSESYSPRAIIYGDSINVANQYWPLGSGFGTFASPGSVKFDQSLFDLLGYTSFWWYTTESYLHDSYWAKYIAETGWLGFIIVGVFYLVIVKSIVGWFRTDQVRQNAQLLRYCAFALSGVVVLILNSPTATTLSDVHGGLFGAMFFGIAWQKVIALRGKRSGVKQQDSLQVADVRPATAY